MPSAFNRPFGQLLSMVTFLLLTILLCVLQPANARTALWQQYHACGKQALINGEWDLAEKYLVGSLQAVRKDNLNPNDWQVQELLADLSHLRDQFDAQHNYKQSEYIGKWLTLMQRPGVQSLPPQIGITSTSGASGIFDSSSASLTQGRASNQTAAVVTRGSSAPEGALPDWGGSPDPNGGGGHGHDHDHDDCHDLKKAIQFLEKSMNQCANGINEMNNLAK